MPERERFRSIAWWSSICRMISSVRTWGASEAEKASPIRIIGIGNNGAVGRLRLAGTDAAIDSAVEAVHRALEGVAGRTHEGID